jgi:SAM-dependent methyltransferase
MSAAIIDRLLSFRKQLAGRAFDRLYGVETNQGVSHSVFAGMSDEIREHAGDYGPTHPALFQRIVQTSGVDPSRYTFVDLGCGKGRILIVAAKYPFKAIVGVEADGSLCKTAKQNLKRWGQRRSDRRVKVVHRDARTFDWPEGNLFIFMYSPFRGPVFKRVAERLAGAAGESGRAMVIAYSADREGDTLEQTGRFTRLRMRRLQFWARSTVSLFYNEAAIRLRN